LAKKTEQRKTMSENSPKCNLYSQAEKEKVFWTEGLRHECQRCLNCCSRPGLVHFSKADVARSSQYIGISESEFIDRYLIRDFDAFVLVVDDGEICPFLEGNSCKIQEKKPLQCRSFPFWPENLVSSATWDEVLQDCAGKDKGELISAKTIQNWLEKQKKLE
jgi:Fe-S-cluster containining protein